MKEEVKEKMEKGTEIETAQETEVGLPHFRASFLCSGFLRTWWTGPPDPEKGPLRGKTTANIDHQATLQILRDSLAWRESRGRRKGRSEGVGLDKSIKGRGCQLKWSIGTTDNRSLSLGSKSTILITCKQFITHLLLIWIGYCKSYNTVITHRWSTHVQNCMYSVPILSLLVTYSLSLSLFLIFCLFASLYVNSSGFRLHE